jgi:hypothetical protein
MRSACFKAVQSIDIRDVQTIRKSSHLYVKTNCSEIQQKFMTVVENIATLPRGNYRALVFLKIKYNRSN